MGKSGADRFETIAPIAEISASDMGEVAPHFEKNQPFIVRGLVKDWPLVQAGTQSFEHARQYLLKHHIDRTFTYTTASETCQGRIFYDELMSMDIQMGGGKLPAIFEQMRAVESVAEQPVIYLGSVDTKHYFEGLREDNPLPMGERRCIESIWIGTKTCIAAHNDIPDNLACVAVGRRRFTLFPPSAMKDMYIGPLENTPAGRPVSMVDLHAPDLKKYPRFTEALSVARTAILEPGDAIYIPSLWWHHIDGLAGFNVLVNYWWKETPQYLGNPQDALYHAIMTIRELPQEQKSYWKDVLDYYVFENTADVTDHIPFVEKSILAPLDAQKAGKIRSYLLRALNS